MIVKSTAFTDNGMIPEKHTGFGEDVSPGFTLTDVPDKAVSLAVILDDRDVPFCKSFTHWIAWNIPKTDVIPEGLADIRASSGRAWGRNRYRGPKPPFFIKKTHRYVFCIYALDCRLDLSEKSRKKNLLDAMRGHILTEAKITGKYKRG